jgi:mono/diheme cytochrome c family protein
MLAVVLLAIATGAAAQDSGDRGALLYDTHCGACHTTEAHWRDKHVVKNWQQLVDQVEIWQANTALNWSGSDIEAVSVYLNRRYYRFPPPAGY